MYTSSDWASKDIADNFIEGAVGYKKAITKSQSTNNSTAGAKSKRVFIVHRHDECAQNKAAGFVEKPGFGATILHEKVSSGRIIIEKIEYYSDVGFASVLYTPDDVGNVKSEAENLNVRARKNGCLTELRCIVILLKQFDHLGLRTANPNTDVCDSYVFCLKFRTLT